MRNLTPSTTVGSSIDSPSHHLSSSSRNESATKKVSSLHVGKTSKGTISFSQKSRHSMMCDNIREASLFIDEQKRVIKKLIKEIQIFIGYREQLPLSHNDSVNQHSWSVYLMHAQSLQSAMKQSSRGKDLFGDGTHPPIRFHLEQNGKVIPFDLPDPCLISMISIRAFISGVSDHKLPSAELGNACIAELLNALIEVQYGSEKLHKISRELENEKQVSVKQDLGLNGSFRQPKSQISWGQKIMVSFYSAIRFSTPVNS
jgi:hypothetical protein